jgi:hypothetical protein
MMKPAFRWVRETCLCVEAHVTALRVGAPIRRRRHGSTASRGRAQRPNTKTFVNAKMNEQIVLE